MEVRYTIPLQPVTKKNSQRIVRCGSYSRIMPSKSYVQYEKECGYFLSNDGPPIAEGCEVTCLFFMKTRRRVDLTNLLEAADDVLVKYGILEDDNSKIIVSHDGSRVLHDPEYPRTEIIIKTID
ncbi:MAG: RusA family crossover junction endodeoxyribonuclease [Clostridiales bacterium]|nr:RusA family crossover junction endodeoxyribonuclease [Clostridiales bacterium]